MKELIHAITILTSLALAAFKKAAKVLSYAYEYSVYRDSLVIVETLINVTEDSLDTILSLPSGSLLATLSKNNKNEELVAF